MARFGESRSNLVAPGRYTARIEDAVLTTTSRGTQAMRITWRIQTPGEFFDVTVTRTTPEWLVCRIAAALGVKKTTDKDGKHYYDIDGVDLIGRELDINVAQREYPPGSGRVYNEVLGDLAVKASGADDDIPF